MVVDWYLLDGFDTGNKLFVDANGLQMVERKLDGNKQLGKVNGTRSVSANYFPVTSAIAVLDTNTTQSNFTEKQVTILNDRPQGGSAGLRQGKNIELMHQRRQYQNSSYGAHAYLNDLDGQGGKGLQIAASYYMLVEDSRTVSLQRPTQKRLEQPLLKFYSHDFSLDAGVPDFRAERTGPQFELDEQLELFLLQVDLPDQAKDFGFNQSVKHYSQGGSFKMDVFAVGQDEIQVRVHNLEDRFDESPNAVMNTYIFNARRFARQFYFEANEHLFTQLPPKKALALLKAIRLEITEMNLAGSLPLADIKKKVGVTQWKTAESSSVNIKPPRDHQFERVDPTKKGRPTGFNFSLEPQRTRVFNIRYWRGETTDLLKAIQAQKGAKSKKPDEKASSTSSSTQANKPKLTTSNY